MAIDDIITIKFLNYPHPTLLLIHAMEIIQFSLLLPTYLVLWGDVIYELPFISCPDA